jgi:hypothetical protein
VARSSARVPKRQQDGPGPAPAPGTGTILFNNSKRETHHAGNGFKKLSRRLKGTYKLATYVFGALCATPTLLTCLACVGATPRFCASHTEAVPAL